MTQRNSVFDVVVIGAGLTGLLCANTLQKKGYSVLILEKSRGLGGRLATRRIGKTIVDHGLSYFLEQGKYSQQLLTELQNHQILEGKEPQSYPLEDTLQKITVQPQYFAPKGMTEIAKYLAQDLTIWRSCRVINLSPSQQNYWHINYESSQDNNPFVQAKILVSAIPAPQLRLLLQASHLNHLSETFLSSIQSVTYYPCLAVMAGYSQFSLTDIPWEQVNFLSDSDLAWIGVESRKRETPSETVIIVHSTPYYAESYLDYSDLQPIGKALIDKIATLLSSSLKSPDWYQVHRWRYAFPQTSVIEPYLETQTPLPLLACGDWCLGNLNPEQSWHIEKAMASGMATAEKVILQLQRFASR